MMQGGFTLAAALRAAAAGMLLGAFFFGGLWWTSRRVLTAAMPGALLAASFVVRMAVLLGGVFYVTRGRWPETLLSVVGVVVARTAVVGAVRRSGNGGE